MSDIVFSLVTGLVSGLIATFFAVGFARFWKTVVEPWFENMVYKDARVEGRWLARGTFDFLNLGQVEEEFSVTLRRIGHHVCGTAVCVSGPDKGLTYHLDGTFRNLLLTCTYTSQNSAALDRGVYSLMLLNNGKTLRGHCLYYCYLEHDVRTCAYEWNREGAIESALGRSLNRSGNEPAIHIEALPLRRVNEWMQTCWCRRFSHSKSIAPIGCSCTKYWYAWRLIFTLTP